MAGRVAGLGRGADRLPKETGGGPPMNTLFLRLEGPLQSWSLRDHWEERSTAAEPTKSGVIGLLGCALGLHRSDERLRLLSEALRMGVRIDRQGTVLVDYHTTGG